MQLFPCCVGNKVAFKASLLGVLRTTSKLILLFFFARFSALGQAPQQNPVGASAAKSLAVSAPKSSSDNSDLNQSSASSAEKTNGKPPVATLRGTGSTAGLTSRYEFWLSLEVLVFGTIIVGLQHLQMKGRDLVAQDSLRVYAITLILVGALFIITAGFDSNQIAPAMGLFGTIAGYLLGKSDSRTGG